MVIRNPLDRKVESYKLDMADRPYSITNLEGQVMSIDYGLGGLVNTVTRLDGTVVSNAYDNRGRLTLQTLPDVTNRLHYLANGLPSVLSNGTSSAVFSYDTLNRPTSLVISNSSR